MPTTKAITLGWAVLLLAVGTVPAADGQEEPGAKQGPSGPAYEFAYDFRSHRFVHYQVVHRTTIDTRKEELEDLTRHATETHKHYRVVSVSDEGGAILEPVIDRVRMAVRFDDGDPIRYDSRKDERPPKQFRHVAGRIGRPLARLKVTRRGRLLSTARLDGRAGDEDDDSAAQNLLVAFPDRPVRVGEVWKERFEVEVSVLGRITQRARMQREYELVSVEDGLATIDYEISTLTPVLDAKVMAQLVQRTPSGRIVFDLERGLLVSRTQEIDETVFGSIGPKSKVHAQSVRVEQLVEPEPRRPKAAASAN